MVSTVWLFVVSTFLYSVSILRVSVAFVCKDDVESETRNYNGDLEEYQRRYCCKAHYNGYSSKWEARWSVKCWYGCCGEEDNQVCCPQPDEGLSGTEIGIIAGSAIFGVIVLVLLIVLFVFIGKKCSTHFKDLRRQKEIHIEINVPREPYIARQNDPVDFDPSQPEPSGLAAPLHRNDDLDFGNEESWDCWGEGVPFSAEDVQVWTTDTAHSAARGRDHPHFQPPPSYESVVQEREQD
ncbi:hypothetical protein V1264_020739 [Littorina saxatilis]|uniref:Uncharacterized protein n=2 Tax=Littorina saxatilis TaxID=31220 RepID=A0AAN9BAR0_9CAEN